MEKFIALDYQPNNNNYKSSLCVFRCKPSGPFITDKMDMCVRMNVSVLSVYVTVEMKIVQNLKNLIFCNLFEKKEFLNLIIFYNCTVFISLITRNS